MFWPGKAMCLSGKTQGIEMRLAGNPLPCSAEEAADVCWGEGGVMMLSVPAAAFTLLLAWIYPSYALYFHIGETEKKCFIEEIPDETMVIGKLAAEERRPASRLC